MAFWGVRGWVYFPQTPQICEIGSRICEKNPPNCQVFSADLSSFFADLRNFVTHFWFGPERRFAIWNRKFAKFGDEKFAT